MVIKLISKDDAKAKITAIDPKIGPGVKKVIEQVLDREITLTPEILYNEKWGKGVALFIEQRLAAPHLHFLEKSQVNGIVGASTVKAISACASKYGIGVDLKKPLIGSDTMRCILDGSKPNEPDLPAGKDSWEWLRYQVQYAGHKFDESIFNRNVIGVRGAMLAADGHSKVVENLGDFYNDIIYIAYRDESGHKVKPFMASVDAGYYYYQLVDISSDQSGCAHLMPGQYKYKLGIHISYQAGVQNGPVQIARSMSANYDLSKCKTQWGYFGINNHAGYDYLPLSQWHKNLGSVWNSSAGCQVIRSAGPDGWHYQTYLGELKSDPDQQWDYTLLEGRKLKV